MFFNDLYPNAPRPEQGLSFGGAGKLLYEGKLGTCHGGVVDLPREAATQLLERLVGYWPNVLTAQLPDIELIAGDEFAGAVPLCRSVAVNRPSSPTVRNQVGGGNTVVAVIVQYDAVEADHVSKSGCTQHHQSGEKPQKITHVSLQ